MDRRKVGYLLFAVRCVGRGFLRSDIVSALLQRIEPQSKQPRGPVNKFWDDGSGIPILDLRRPSILPDDSCSWCVDPQALVGVSTAIGDCLQRPSRSRAFVSPLLEAQEVLG